MQIFGTGKETYLFINGLHVNRKIDLGNQIDLLPAKCSVGPEVLLKVGKYDLDIGVAILFLNRISCQLHITADDSKELAIRAWNSLWDAVLLSALFNCEAICNFQSVVSAEVLRNADELKITNYHLRGLSNDPPYEVTESDAEWLERNFESARQLLKDERFTTAIHCLAFYKSHTHPRARLALLWAGIEGLFDVSTELIFRMSLYVSRFLEPDDVNRRRELFVGMKKLYDHRSKAVHGATLKDDPQSAIDESAELLRRILWRCVSEKRLPEIDQLAP